ncbi:MAG: hypothetical protein ACLFV2_05085 [Desulfurivibrionaceae bacterium]
MNNNLRIIVYYSSSYCRWQGPPEPSVIIMSAIPPAFIGVPYS